MTARQVKPWRAVEYIGHATGERGGQTWVLVLSCGHTVHRPFPRLGPDAALVCFSPRRLEAPRRVRCEMCGAGLDPSPERIPAAVDLVERHWPIGGI